MGFILDGLDADAYDRTYGDRELVRRIVSYFLPQRRRIIFVVSMVVATTAMQAIIPIVVSRGIDLLSGNPLAQLALGIAGLTAMLGVLSWLFNFVRQSFSAIAIGEVVLKLREDAFAAVMQRDLSFYDQYPSGTIVSRVTTDTQDFSNVVTLTIDLLSQLLLVVVAAAILFVIEPFLAALAVGLAPFIFLIAISFRRIARLTSQQARRAIANVNATVQETISGIAVAKSFRQEAAIYTDFAATNQLAYRVRLRQGLVFDAIFPVLDISVGLTTALIVYAGGIQVLDGRVSTGDWYLFIQTLFIFAYPLTSIASFWSQFQQGLAASERVFALIDAEPRVLQRSARTAPPLKGEIRFSDVHFSYAQDGDATKGVLNGFNLTIPAGQRIAVVGHTGAGKSSLVRLITRFYEFQSGTISVDGLDLRELDLASYRRQVGLVPQVPFLFSGSVADNIRYGRPEASDAEVVAAAGQIGNGEWLADLPQGMASEVGERGAQLSLGQRQLVALARVMLQNPAIFILDEATASVDPFTEEQIQAGLDAVMHGRTSIIIAHRLSTVRSADRIIVMKAGTIIEEGSHASLLAQGGHYAELYRTYFRHQSLSYIEQVGNL